MKYIFREFHSKIVGKRLLFMCAALLMCGGHVWGSSYTLTVNATHSPSGAGKVYVNTDENDDASTDPGENQYKESDYASRNNGSDSETTRTFYLFTAPTNAELSVFSKWSVTDYDQNQPTLENAELAKGATVSVKTKRKDQNIYVNAEYVTHCRLYANSSPSSGGYVYVTDKSLQKDESFVKGKALTSDYADRTEKTIFTASAAPATGYHFKGWATSESYGSYVSTQQLNAEVEIDVLNKVTWYAMFMPYWKFSVSAVATVSGVESTAGGTVSASVENNEIEGPVTSNTASTKATFQAVPADGYGFAGWAKSPGTMSIADGYYSNPLELTIENTAKGTTEDLTLYAVFYELVDPTAMDVSPANMDLAKDVTGQIVVAMTPTLSYRNITYTSSNPAAATVSSAGVVTGVKSGKSTITVTAKKKDGTVAFTRTVEVKVMEKLPAPVLNVEPSQSDKYNKALVTITAGENSPAGTVIRYTMDGTDPTATSIQYTAPFKLDNLATVKARAYCTDWYESDIVSQKYSKQKTSTPVIKITLSDGAYLVSFSCVDDDVTYYYTTDGSLPTYDKSTGAATGNAQKVTSGDAFNPNVTECSIKVIAAHADWQDSDCATKDYVRASGIDGSTVYLNDYEDHTWTYYAGIGDMSTNPYSYPARLYSPNPRNVKIIYDGKGGKVSIDESETRFIYYETLEQGSTQGQYPYTVISNPFSKRPTGQGFAGWKIVDGGEYISGKSNNDVLSLDETITFVDLPYPSVNCTSATIKLEATWTTANINYATSGTINFSGGTYETNFVVMKSASSSTLTLSSPCTVMAVEPDGTGDYRSNKFSGTISPNNTTMSKIEFVNWQYGSSFNAKGKNVTFGRGLTTTSRTISTLTACDGNTANQVFKIESGKYTNFYNYSNMPESITKQYVIFGCDYDRAKNDNTKLNITSSMYISECRVTQSDDVEVCRVYSKSGQFVSEEEIGTATADESYYFGFSGTESWVGYRYLEIQGGVWHNIAGGMSTSHSASKIAVEYRMKGGTVLGSMYGAAQYANAAGIRKFVYTGGTVNGWIAGGANGTDSTGGELDGETFVYIGGRCQVTSNNSTTIINHAVGGNVFGAGCGNGAKSDAGIVNNGTNVVLADDAYVERGVYGGGGFGYTTATSNIFVTGGHCGGVKGGVNSGGSSIDNDLQGGVFGGACQNKGGTVKILMTGGIIEGGLYGGSNATGAVSSVDMTITGGQIGTKTNLAAMACGGGYGSGTTVSGNVNMILGISGFKDFDNNDVSPYFYGNCYGGAALGEVTGNVSLTINTGGSYAGGSDTGGEIYCGGLGQSGNTTYGNVDGTLTTVINGTDARPSEETYAYNAVYGGSHYINQSKTPSVTVNGCDVSIKELYGGSKLATLSGTNIMVNGGNTIGSLYGGSNAANINGNVSLKVYGGGVDRVFGGNNNSGTISGTINMQIDQQSGCDMRLGEVYGGGNKAASNSVKINIGCPGYIGQLYGGANEANITGNIVLDVHGGTYGTIYGGNNKSGTISGSVTINASKDDCALQIDTIFGGGNLADLAQTANKVTVNVSGNDTKVGSIYGGGNKASVYSTTVNVSGGQISGNIFGGGKGEKGSSKNMILNGGTNVNITGGTLTNVFGGNDAGGTITGTLKTTIDKDTSLDITGEVYGGGNEASSTAGQLNIECADHIGTVYGGARNADISGNIDLKIGSGTIDNVFGGNNLGGSINGTITVDVQHSGCSVINIGNLYGAGNLADYTVPSGNAYGPIINLKTCARSTVDWQNAGTHCLKIGTIYGAGMGSTDGDGKGKVIGNPQVNVNAGEIGTIYGGGNMAAVEGSTYVNIIDASTTDGQDIYITGNVYGGGNNASVTGSTSVQVGPQK